MITLTTRIINWIKRFRHRCGYNVHSPSDFFLITSVIYENYPYYAYKHLSKQIFNKSEKYRNKVYRLLFRLINYYGPKSVVDIACDGGRGIAYISAASNGTVCYSFDDCNGDVVLEQINELLDKIKRVDFVHIGFTPHYKEIYDRVVEHTDEKSIVIVGSPYSSKQKRDWWKSIKDDNRAVITFDLYDIGIILFPEKRYKQNYIVNFL